MKYRRNLAVIIGVHLLFTISYSQSIVPPFNVNGVIRHGRGDQKGSGEFLIDTNVVYTQALNHQFCPSSAFDGVNYLVVWMDSRDGSGEVYGARISQAGVVLDSTGIAISSGMNRAGRPCIAFDGSNYLVVWEDYRSGLSYDLYGTRISPGGSVIDSLGFVISSEVYDEAKPTIAFDGINYLVVWQDAEISSNSNIYGVRVSTTGGVLDTIAIAISTAMESQSEPSIAFDGINYLVVWEDFRNGVHSSIYGARVSPAGTVLDSAGIVIVESGTHPPSVAFDGANYLVVWTGFYNNIDIYGTRVTPSGTILDTTGIVISTAAYDQQFPSVAFDGSNYLVVWEDYRSSMSNPDIYGARVSSTGAVLDSTGIAISTAVYWQIVPSIIFGAANYLVVWVDARCGPYKDHICGARVNKTGVVLEPSGIPISTAAYGQKYPSSAFDGTNYLVVWEDYRTDSYSDIYGARVNQAGAILDPSCITISTAANDQVSPSIAFGGDNYLVVWEDSSRGSYFDIYGSRVSQNGTVLDSSGIAISNANRNQSSPAISFDGMNYFVVWTDERNGYPDVYGARVSQAGIVIDPAGTAISTTIFSQWAPSVAFDGTNYLVVWTDWQGRTYDIYGARVNQSGILLDSVNIAVTTAANNQIYPSIAFDGTNYLVVWSDDRNQRNHYDIYGARVNRLGIVLDSLDIAISTTANDQQYPSVTFDGTNYVAVWEDSRFGAAYDIYGARISPTGVVIDSFAAVLQSRNQSAPVIAHGKDTQVLIAYSGFCDRINHRPANTMRIWGKFLEPVGVVDDRSQKLEARNILNIAPNPFVKLAKVSFSVGQGAKDVALKIYDVTGRVVKNFNSSFFIPVAVSHGRPSHVVSWNGDDDSGTPLPAGVYFCRLESGEFNITEKIVKLK